jgi:hypothetical protein
VTSSSQAAAADTELLGLAGLVLRDSGYTVEDGATNGLPYLVAEDLDNVLVAGAVVAIEDVFAIEPTLRRVLLARLGGARAESKKWDGYVVILTSTRPDESMSEALFDLTYNLSEARRLVRVGVEPTTADVARSLRAVLPLTKPSVDGGLVDPLTALEKRLVADGLGRDEVAEAIAGFRAEPREVPGVVDEGADDMGIESPPGETSGEDDV